MINLLPDETKKQLRAAHTNVGLLRYITFSSIGIGFLIIACIVSFFFIENANSSGSAVSGDEKSTTTLYNTAKDQLSRLTSNISTAKKILDQQINYSEVITEIAAALPSGMVLENLSIDGSSNGAPVTIQINARSVNNLEQLKANFQTSKSPLFSNFSVVSTTPNASNTSGYATKITCTLTIKKGVIQ